MDRQYVLSHVKQYTYREPSIKWYASDILPEVCPVYG